MPENRKNQKKYLPEWFLSYEMAYQKSNASYNGNAPISSLYVYKRVNE